MPFITPLQWSNAGTEPSTSLKQNGFVGGYRPAAKTFNYYLHNQQVCTEELQEFFLTPKGCGKSMAGQSVFPTQEGAVTAQTGAEIFNDYRARGYYADGTPGAGNVATGMYSHAEGTCTTAIGDYSHAEGEGTIARGVYSHAEGFKTITDEGSHAEGYMCEATTSNSHVEGEKAKTTQVYSHAEGFETEASGVASHAEGMNATASRAYSHAEGYKTQAMGECSHTGGQETLARGVNAYAKGYRTEANNYQAVFGINNSYVAGPEMSNDTSGSVFIVGCGTETSISNAFRVSKSGQCYGKAAWASTGADYAEYFEWLDSNSENEDRRGLLVALENGKIRKANGDDDYILGVVSVKPAIVGNNYDDNWHGMYIRDVFGDRITETENVEGKTITKFVLNPEYDPTREYVSRENRAEWDAIGTHGQLVVIDDGTCEVNSYCTAANGGIATATDRETPYRVIRRLDDNHIKVYINSR